MTDSDVTRTAISLRLPSDLKLRIDEAARLDHRSTTDLVIAVLSCWLEGRRYEPVARLAAVTAPKAPRVNPVFTRPPGRPRRANENARQPYLIELLERRTKPDEALSLTETVARVAPKGSFAVGFPITVEDNLRLRDWLPFTRSADGQTLWLGPDHPHRREL